MIKLYSLICVIILFSCTKEPKPLKQDAKVQKQETVKSTYVLETFESISGWGYTILNNGKPFIIQKHIPAIQGTNGFNTESDAKKCGLFVIEKIKNGVMPPSITKEELQRLGINN